MDTNAFILDWTMDDYGGLLQALIEARFSYRKETGTEHVRVEVPHGRVTEYASLCQSHLNAPFNYVDVQFPAERQTVIVFRQKVFINANMEENAQAVQWALAQGLPEAQADWPTSF